MKITPSNDKNFVPEVGINKLDIPSKNWTLDGIYGSDGNDKSKVVSDRKVEATKQVLTTNEMSTLHLLFGSNKPDELSFYGQSKVQPINKGQFVDMFG